MKVFKTPKSSSLKQVFTGKGNWYDYVLLVLFIGMMNPWTFYFAFPVAFLLMLYERHTESKDEACPTCKNTKNPNP